MTKKNLGEKEALKKRRWVTKFSRGEKEFSPVWWEKEKAEKKFGLLIEVYGLA